MSQDESFEVDPPGATSEAAVQKYQKITLQRLDRQLTMEGFASFDMTLHLRRLALILMIFGTDMTLAELARLQDPKTVEDTRPAHFEKMDPFLRDSDEEEGPGPRENTLFNCGH